jgi:hypothetical protein
MFYCMDKTTGKRTSLQTTNRDEAQQVMDAKNQAERQPMLNLHIAKAYLAGTDNGMTTRSHHSNALPTLQSRCMKSVSPKANIYDRSQTVKHLKKVWECWFCVVIWHMP